MLGDFAFGSLDPSKCGVHDQCTWRTECVPEARQKFAGELGFYYAGQPAGIGELEEIWEMSGPVMSGRGPEREHRARGYLRNCVMS